MTARTFLIYGLLAGLLAGLAAFLVAHQIGEPHVNAAIAVEEANSAAEESADHDHAATETEEHSHAEDGTVVSRANQSTWGLLTGTLAVGLATGGLVSLIAAGVAGRIPGASLAQSTAIVAVAGYISYSLVPFLKYPATPPAVGNPDTIGSRTELYFSFVAFSLVAAVIAAVAAVKLRGRFGTFTAVVASVVGYLVLVVAAGMIFPTVNEVGDFPADTLWFFRRASLLTLTTMWGVLGVVLVGLLVRRESGAPPAGRAGTRHQPLTAAVWSPGDRIRSPGDQTPRRHGHV